MTIELDHLILGVNDLSRSIAFYTRILGLVHEGERAPFAVLRVTPSFVLLLAPFGTEGGQHLAFAMSQGEFEAAFARIRADAVPYGDRFDQVGNMRGPADEEAARGIGKTLYFFDPDRHLLEIRHYD